MVRQKSAEKRATSGTCRHRPLHNGCLGASRTIIEQRTRDIFPPPHFLFWRNASSSGIPFTNRFQRCFKVVKRPLPETGRTPCYSSSKPRQTLLPSSVYRRSVGHRVTQKADRCCGEQQSTGVRSIQCHQVLRRRTGHQMAARSGR